MTCIHGLDEVNCPACRFARATIPLNPINKIELNKNFFLLKNSPFERNRVNTENIYKELVSNKISTLNLIGPQLKPNLLGEIPDFTNTLFNERINALDLAKSNPKIKIALDDHDIANQEN